MSSCRPLYALRARVLLAAALLLGACANPAEEPGLATSVWADMVRIDGGEFQMGSDGPGAKAAEGPQHPVVVRDFYLARFEVTQALFEAVMGPSNSYFTGADMPVNNLSWQQANHFVDRLNELTGKRFRLPTEAEWEYAAQGGALSQGFTYSGSNDIDAVAWYRDNAQNRAHPVGHKAPNELGLYDMTGNVGEFCQDAYEKNFYRYGPKENPNNAEHSDKHLMHKSVRGGSFSYDADESENFRRDFASQSVIMADMGLRLAHDAR